VTYNGCAALLWAQERGSLLHLDPRNDAEEEQRGNVDNTPYQYPQ
jgi:hypothetical protein